MSPPRTVGAVTCLGCGCACDDLTVTVSDGRIARVDPPCPLAVAWFGDGSAPEEARVEGRSVPVERALAAAAELLADAAGRVLVYLAPDLTTRAHRAALALADRLRAELDGSTSEPAAAGLLVAQRRGRAASTLGEIRNRADLVLYWGIDPAERYPRYVERYAPPVEGRTVIAVSVGADRGPPGATLEARFAPDEEIAALSVLRAAVLGQAPAELPERLRPAGEIAARLLQARYAAIVHEAEPGRERRDPRRAEGLVALTQALNGPTRATLSSLRSGGNRSGAEAVVTWQTGYPFAVNFEEGFPRYTPARRGAGRPRGETEAVLVAGTAAGLPEGAAQALARTRAILVGPHATTVAGARIAIDTGVAGIHEGGTAYRMDEVPLPLTPPLPGRRSTADTLAALLGALGPRVAGAGR